MRFYLRALSYFRDDLGKIILSLLLIGVSTYLGLLQVFPLSILIDHFANAKPDDPVYRFYYRYFPSDGLRFVLTLAAGMVILRVMQELLNMVQTLLNYRIGYNGLLRVRCDLFRKLQELSIGYHKSQPQGDAIYRLSYDTYGVQVILNVFAQTVLVSSVTLIIMTVIMLNRNWQLTLIALSVAPLLIITTKFFSKVLYTRAVEAKEVDTRLTTTIQRSVASIGLVQAFGREADEYARFRDTAHQSIGASMRLHTKEFTYWVLVGSIFGLGSAMIFGYGGYLVLNGKLSAGQLSIFLAYLGTQLYGPLNKLSSSAASIQGGVAGCHRVFEVLDRDPIIRDAPDAVHLPRQSRVLELENVGFSYREGSDVLREVNVTIRPGEMVAFVGSSGVGKTTLLNLLPRFYDPTTGALKLDGTDLRNVMVKDLRKHIALVLQDSVILPTTVAENIAYGRPDATEQQIHHAAEIAGAAAFIEKLPDKYNHQVNEAGQNLSGGQKQRIAIARALLTEAPIIVMDEPTSALDPQNEQMIIETLRTLKRQRTIILVSHRLSTVADCDQIFVMDEGRIVERGTHDGLVAKHGLYFTMAKHQMRLEEPTTVTNG